MAYDENGNYFFNPHVDEDDAALVQDEHKRIAARKFAESQQDMQKDQQDFSKMWNESLKEEGLDQQAYAELYNADPEGARAALKQSMTHVAKSVSRGRDNKGRFTKQQTQGTPGKNVQRRETAHHSSEPALADIKARVAKGENVSDDAILEAMFPDPLY